MKKQYLAYAALPVLAFAFLGAGAASAHGWFGFGMMNNTTPEQFAQAQADRFTREAELLGVSADEVKNAWAQGQTLQELAAAKGITEEQLRQKMTDLRQQEMKIRLQTLVSRGIITQAQADQREAFMNSRQSEDEDMGPGHMGRGDHHGGEGGKFDL